MLTNNTTQVWMLISDFTYESWNWYLVYKYYIFPILPQIVHSMVSKVKSIVEHACILCRTGNKSLIHSLFAMRTKRRLLKSQVPSSLAV